MPLLNRPARLAGCLALLLAFAVSCTSGEPQKPPAPQQSAGAGAGGSPPVRMTISMPQEPATLNPLAGFAPYGSAQFYDGLLEHATNGMLNPDLAAALPQPDVTGTSWTVPLRSGITFSDGSTFGAEDVLATYRAVIDPRFGSPLRAEFANLRAVDQTADGQVRFQLAGPDPRFAAKLVLGILPASALATPKPVSELAVSTNPVGTGPFRLTSWKHGHQLTMAARPGYFRGKPQIDVVTVQFEPDSARRLAAARAGTVDATEVDNGVRQAGVDGTETVTSGSSEYRAISLPEDNPLTADPAVRKAMNFAVDRSALVASALGGIGEPASTPFTDALPEFVDPQAVYPHDVASAVTLLIQAGWRSGADGTRAKGATAAQLRLAYPSGDPAAKALATAFADDMKEIGIQVTPFAGHPGAGDAELISAGSPFDPDPGSLGGAQLSSALATARAQTDLAQRSSAYRGADRTYLGYPTMVVLARMEHTYLVADRWRGDVPVLDPAQPDFTWGLFHDLRSWTS